MIKQSLKSIGLTDGEIKIYLALLEIGSSSIGNIIKKSKISGSKTYEVLEIIEQLTLIHEKQKLNPDWKPYFSQKDILSGAWKNEAN